MMNLQKLHETFAGCRCVQDVQERLNAMTFEQLKELLIAAECSLQELDLKICKLLVITHRTPAAVKG